MKSSRLEACLSYIKFTLINEGEEPEDFPEDVFESILREDISSSDAIDRYLESKDLKRVELKDGTNPFDKYPGTRCRVNFFGIKDKELLDEVDRIISAMRMAELFVTPLPISFSVDYLKALHVHMFGDIYPSAGIYRTKSVAKRTEFVPPEFIERMLYELFEKLEETDYLTHLDEDDDSEDFLSELAYFMGELEAIHPFVDGNGRVARFFISQIAKNAGYFISWGSVDPDHLLEASIAAIDGDYQALVDLLEEITMPLDGD